MAMNILKEYLPDKFSFNVGLPTNKGSSNTNKGFLSGLFGKSNSPSNIPSSPTTTITHAFSGIEKKKIFLRVISYLLAIFIAIMVILLFVHFMITPIFILHPGDSGYIPIPGFDDGKLFLSLIHI